MWSAERQTFIVRRHTKWPLWVTARFIKYLFLYIYEYLIYQFLFLYMIIIHILSRYNHQIKKTVN